jgi:hypothetical protein
MALEQMSELRLFEDVLTAAIPELGQHFAGRRLSL